MYPKNHRNYRIITHKDKIKGSNEYDEWVGLHEIHYLNGKINIWSSKPAVIGNDIDDLIGGLELMLKDAKKCKENQDLIYTEKQLKDTIKQKKI